MSLSEVNTTKNFGIWADLLLLSIIWVDAAVSKACNLLTLISRVSA